MHHRARPSGHATRAHRPIGIRNIMAGWRAGALFKAGPVSAFAAFWCHDILFRMPRVRSSSGRDRQPSRPAALPACSKGAMECRDASPKFRHLHGNRASRHETASGPDGASRYSCPIHSCLAPKAPTRCLLQCSVPCTRQMDHPDACRGSGNPGLRPQVLCFNLQRSAVDSTVTPVFVGYVVHFTENGARWFSPSGAGSNTRLAESSRVMVMQLRRSEGMRPWWYG